MRHVAIAPGGASPRPPHRVLANREGVAVTNVTLSLAAPAGRTATPGNQTTPSLAAAATFGANWTVTAAAPAQLLEPGRLAATAMYTVGGQTLTYEQVKTVTMAEPGAAPLQTAATAEAYFGQRGSRLAVLAGGMGRAVFTGLEITT